jgi:hypothetical protein
MNGDVFQRRESEWVVLVVTVYKTCNRQLHIYVYIYIHTVPKLGFLFIVKLIFTSFVLFVPSL